ncbi:MAG: hypothetical protein H7282_09325 [Cytophagaceae bacterium]|nr:hypothetical protein [Cytophagaceae bacterium]
MIPHEHFEEEEIENHLSHSQDHGHEHSQDGDLDENLNLFSFVEHTGFFVPSHVEKISYHQQISVLALWVILSFGHIQANETPPKIPESLVHALSDYISSCSSLRAPPFLFS